MARAGYTPGRRGEILQDTIRMTVANMVPRILRSRERPGNRLQLVLRVLISSSLIAGVLSLPVRVLGAQDDVDEEERELVVRGLSFSGNEAIDDYTLRVSIATSNSSFFARTPVIRWLGLGEKRYYNEQEFRRDVLRIRALYEASGYPAARVDTVVNRHGESVDLEFRIREGDPRRLTSVTISGTEGIVSPSRLLQRIPLKVGDPFNRLLIAPSTDTILTALRNRGYPYVEVFRQFEEIASTHGDSLLPASAVGTAEVSFTVDPGPFARVERIEIVGNEEYDDRVIRRVLSIREGQPFSQRALDLSQLDLYRMNTFNYVNVALKDSIPESVDDSLVTVEVQVAEGALRRIRLGMGYGTIDCIRTRSSWTINNFMGDAQTLDLDARVSRVGAEDFLGHGLRRNLCRALLREDGRFLKLNFNVSATFRERFLFDRRTSALLSVSAERHSEFTAFMREAYGGQLAITRQTPVRIPITGSYALSRDKTIAEPATFCSLLDVCTVESADSIFTKFRRRSAVSFSLVRDRLDSPLDPSRGSLFQLDMRHASQFIWSDELRQFTRGVAELSSHYRTGRRSVFSWRVRVGGVTAPKVSLDGEQRRFIPPEERFYAGGPSSVRGFSQNELGPFVRVIDIDGRSNDSVFVRDPAVPDGPVDTLTGRLRTSPTGGDAIVLANVEYRFPLTRRLSGGVFVDAGKVFAIDEEASSAGLRITPGAGIRLASPLGPIRLDVGYNPWPAEGGRLFKLIREEGRPKELMLVEIAENQPFIFTPDRGFLGRFRIHFSVGQAF